MTQTKEKDYEALEAQAAVALIYARTQLVVLQPFFGMLVLRLKLQAEWNLSTPTMATDGRAIYYDPSFVVSLAHRELMGVLCHEVLHCANGHPWRARGMSKRELGYVLYEKPDSSLSEKELAFHTKWNDACDYAINPFVVSTARLELPDFVLLNDRFAGKPAEEIFYLLEDSDAPKNENARIGAVILPGDGGDGGGIDNDSSSGTSLEQEWVIATKQAASYARAVGQLSAGLEQFVEVVTRPKVDWKSLLRRFVQAHAKADYTWSTPRSRYLPLGIYMPELRSEQMPKIVVVVDTSGSISTAALSQFLREIQCIIQDVRPETTYVVWADAAVQGVDELDPSGPIPELKPKGRGGTDFRPAFEWAQKTLDDEVACVVYLTDMYGPAPQVPPPYPTMWVVTGTWRGDVPFGEQVRLEL